jgi:hypothetical protein
MANWLMKLNRPMSETIVAEGHADEACGWQLKLQDFWNLVDKGYIRFTLASFPR